MCWGSDFCPGDCTFECSIHNHF
uniref:Uncharacterized protein n=1 Tax=Rhizophora mucronata TaxID=61149 RepID=A0A2P2PEA5_RHIMU